MRNTSTSFNWEYVFNIGGNVKTPPTCSNTTGSDGKSSTAPAPAFQLSLDKGNAFCHRLGGDMNDDVNWALSVSDVDNPAAGVVVTYENGDACPDQRGYIPSRRQLKIFLDCTNDDTPLPSSELVEETVQCSYNMHIKVPIPPYNNSST